jgi:hypothetical protein
MITKLLTSPISSTLIPFQRFTLAFSAYSKADFILKDYFSTRLKLKTRDLELFMTKLSGCKINDRDHRWINLNMTIEKYLDEFALPAKLRILKMLAQNNNPNSLFTSIYA